MACLLKLTFSAVVVASRNYSIKFKLGLALSCLIVSNHLMQLLNGVYSCKLVFTDRVNGCKCCIDGSAVANVMLQSTST